MEEVFEEPGQKRVKIDSGTKMNENEFKTKLLENNEQDLPNHCENNPTLSKRQLKKIRKLEQWEIKKKEKRIKEREKYKKKKLEALANGLPTRTGPSRKELKKNKSEASDNNLKIVIDLDFDNLMIDKDICKCVKQLLRVYTINRRSSMPAKLWFTGVTENGRIHKTLERNDGYQNWDVQWHYKPYTEVLDTKNVIYLTSDSENVLKDLSEDTFYVIGGLVDHNHHKGLCHERATKLGLKTARLPLSEHVEIKTRTVLSIVHVFEMLLRVSEGKNWTETILNILPMRKGAKCKDTNNKVSAAKANNICTEIGQNEPLEEDTNKDSAENENIIPDDDAYKSESKCK